MLLSHFFPRFRLDLSDDGAILTQDDKKKPALYIERGTESYEVLSNTIFNDRRVSCEITCQLSRGVDFENAACGPERLLAFDVEVKDLNYVQQDVGTLIENRWYRYL